MKKTILIPDPFFRAAEREAVRGKISFSRFYLAGLAPYLGSLPSRDATVLLDAIYSAQDSAVDSVLMSFQRETLDQEEW